VIDELSEQFRDFSEATISVEVFEAASEIYANPEYAEYRRLFDVDMPTLTREFKVKKEMVRVVEEEDEPPPHYIEALKELIKKAALRKLKQLEEEEKAKTAE
jgi:hypothetical protein